MTAMSVLRGFKKLYSLDTLDTRFTTSAKRLDAQTRSATAASREDKSRIEPITSSPSRWKTPEFAFYGLVFVLVVPLMFYTVWDLSQPWAPNYAKFEPLLSSGWIPGRKVDNADAQYANFRDNLPYLGLLVVIHPILRRFYEYWRSKVDLNQPQKEKNPVQPNGKTIASSGFSLTKRAEHRIQYDVIFNCILLAVLHGFSSLKVLLILFLNYSLTKRVSRRYVVPATWAFNIGILFANDLGHGYPFMAIAKQFSFSNLPSNDSRLEWAAFLDRYGGLIPRWEVLFNITILRLISFNLDHTWAKDKGSNNVSLEKKQLDPAHLTEEDRIAISAGPAHYSFRNYLAYTLYAPLYLAGPIVTFNDYMAQQHTKASSITSQRTLMYGIRFLLALLSMELMLHFTYVVAISKSSPDWHVYTPFQLSMLGYFVLHHIWLKLLLPWRFFRLWALVDGIDPPENMVRCMSNNYSTFAFWRGWHRSFNRWILRYIYIPLGGSGTQSTSTAGDKKQGNVLGGIVNMLLVFSFVALWHDIQLRLLIWGWLITLFVLPEALGSWLFPPSKWKDRPERYRILCGIGGIGNALMMMFANLVGFALGTDGFRDLVKGITGSYSGLAFFTAAIGAVFVGIQVMFELRQEELRHGINMKC